MEIDFESRTKWLQESKSGQRWDVAEDGTGHLYFYTADGDSVWQLPLTDNSSSTAGNNCHHRYYMSPNVYSNKHHLHRSSKHIYENVSTPLKPKQQSLIEHLANNAMATTCSLYIQWIDGAYLTQLYNVDYVGLFK